MGRDYPRIIIVDVRSAYRTVGGGGGYGGGGGGDGGCGGGGGT